MIGKMFYFLPLLSRSRVQMALTLALSVLAVGAGIALLGLSGWFITAAAISGAGALFNIIGPSAAIRGLSLTRIIARYGERYAGHALTLDLVSRTRTWLLGRLFQRVPLPQTFSRADVVNRLVADLDMLDSIFLVALGPIVTAMLTTIAMSAGLALVLPSAALPYAALYLLATTAVPVWLLWGGRTATSQAAAATAELRNELLEGMDGYKDLLHLGRTDRIVGGTGRAAATLHDARLRLARLAAAASLAVNLLAGGALLAVLLAGLDALRATRIDGALFAGVLLATLASFEAAQSLIRSATRLSASIGAAERVIDLAEGPVEVAPPQAINPPRRGEIALRGVSFSYPGHPAILRRATLEVAAGERIAITGPSGSGKSTIARLMLKLIEPGAGQCCLDGVAMTELDPAEVRRRVALMTQDAPVFDISVRDNLRLGAPAADDPALWKALDLVGLAGDFRSRQGLDTMVGEAGAALSVGQGRRLALARTLMTGADIIVLDEPTSGLDREAEGRFWTALDAAGDNRTMIVITHGCVPEWFDRTLLLRDGKLVG